MADSNIVILQQTGSSATIDTRTEGTNSEHRQVVVIGDPTTNTRGADVRFTDPASNDGGMVVRDINTSAIAGGIRVTHLVDGTISTVVGLTEFLT